MFFFCFWWWWWSTSLCKASFSLDTVDVSFCAKSSYLCHYNTFFQHLLGFFVIMVACALWVSGTMLCDTDPSLVMMGVAWDCLPMLVSLLLFCCHFPLQTNNIDIVPCVCLSLVWCQCYYHLFIVCLLLVFVSNRHLLLHGTRLTCVLVQKFSIFVYWFSICVLSVSILVFFFLVLCP